MTVQLRLAVLFSMIATGICQLQAQDYPQQSYDDLATNQFKRCGIPNRKGFFNRIVGGQNADQNEYPWMVGIAFSKDGDIDCSGSIISSKTILTAAHCFEDEMWVVVGEHEIGKSQGEGRIKVCNKEKHEKYEVLPNGSRNYDVGVLHLCTEIAFTKEIAPVCLPTTAGQGTQFEGKNAAVIGWGRTNFGWGRTNWGLPTILQEVTVKTMKNSECCKAPYDWYKCFEITDSMICAAAPGKDTCNKDSGGPLVIKENYSYTQVGITSFGEGCARADAPGVYVRVTHVLQWIKARTKGTKGLVPTTPTPDSCQKGGRFYSRRHLYFRGSFYYFYKYEAWGRWGVSWKDAEKFCRISVGGELASIITLAEFDFIVTTLKELKMGNTFIGGKRKSQYSDEWILSNGLPFDAVRFKQAWASGEPNNYRGKENALMIAAPVFSWNKDKYSLADFDDFSLKKWSFVCRIYC